MSPECLEKLSWGWLWQQGELNSGWRRCIQTTSLVPRVTLAWAAPCGPQLGTPLCAAGFEPQQEPWSPRPLVVWAVVSRVGRSLLRSISTSQRAGSICWRRRKLPFLGTQTLVAAGGSSATATTFFSSVWKGSGDCWASEWWAEGVQKGRAKGSALGDISCVLCVIAGQFSTCFKTDFFIFPMCEEF